MQFGISESIAHWAKYRQQHVAVLYNSGKCTFRELDAAASIVAAHVDNLDQRFQRVAIAVSRKLDYLISLIGVLRSGRSVVLLNCGLPGNALAANIQEAQVEAVLFDRPYVQIADLVSGRAEQRIELGPALSRPPGRAQVPSERSARSPEAEWGVFFSSGTTGIPKGIVRDHESVTTELLGWCLDLGLNRKDIFYIGRPIFYTGGLVLTLASLLVAGSVVLDDYKEANSPSEVWQDYQSALSSTRFTWAFFVPDQVRAFTADARASSQSPLSAMTILVMGAPISGAEKAAARNVLGSQVVESWGNSESLGTITDAEDVDSRPNSVGRPFLTDEMSIVDENCIPVPPGHLGRIAGGQESGFNEYCSQPEATAMVKRNELIVSEDIGYVDENGYFYVVGRLQDSVSVDGVTVFLSAIEAKIRERYGNLQFCVVALGPEGGNVEIVGVVEVAVPRQAAEGDLIAGFNEILLPAERLHRLRTVSSLPRVASGKVDRMAARKIAEST